MPENHMGQDSPSSKIANTSAGRASSSTAFLKRMGAVSKNDASTGWQGKGMALTPRAAEEPTVRYTAKSSCGAPISRSSFRRGAVDAQHHDLGGHDLRWPGDVGKAARQSNFLRPVRYIGDHAAADRAAELPAPELLAGSSVEGIEVAANIAEEYDAPGRRSHAAEDRIVRLQAPLPLAGV